MKKFLLILSILSWFLIPSFTVLANEENSVNKIDFNGTTITIDQPASLDAYVICYDNNAELWHTKLFSYEYISGVSMEAQKVFIKAMDIEENMVKIIDSRNVVYYIDPLNGNLLETNTNDYSLPDFSTANSNTSPPNKNGTIKYLAVFGAFIGVGIIVFIASRNKK